MKTKFATRLRRVDSCTREPCGLRIERIDPLPVLAGCRKRRLNQAVCPLSDCVCFVIFTRAAFVLPYFVFLCVLSPTELIKLSVPVQVTD